MLREPRLRVQRAVPEQKREQCAMRALVTTFLVGCLLLPSVVSAKPSEQAVKIDAGNDMNRCRLVAVPEPLDPAEVRDVKLADSEFLARSQAGTAGGNNEDAAIVVAVVLLFLLLAAGAAAS